MIKSILVMSTLSNTQLLDNFVEEITKSECIFEGYTNSVWRKEIMKKGREIFPEIKEKIKNLFLSGKQTPNEDVLKYSFFWLVFMIVDHENITDFPYTSKTVVSDVEIITIVQFLEAT